MGKVKSSALFKRAAKLALAVILVSSGLVVDRFGQLASAAGTDSYVFERKAPGASIYFQYVTDVAVDDAGIVFVADFGKKEVRVFHSSGQELGHWGAEASPEHIAVSEGYLYAALSNDTIIKLSVSESYAFSEVKRWDGAGKFGNIGGLAVDSDKGLVFASDYGYNAIWKLDESLPADDVLAIMSWDSYEEIEGTTTFKSPRGIAIGSEGELYIAEEGDRIIVVDTDGVLQDEWESGQGGIEINSIGDLMLDDARNLYVTSKMGNQLVRFNEAWEAEAVGSEGRSGGLFDNPMGVAVAQDGLVYVVDNNNNRVQKFDAGLEFQASWENSGGDPGRFFIPQHIALDKKGFVYVADTGNNRVQKFDDELSFVQAEQGQSGFEPFGIAVDSEDNVYMTSYSSLLRYDALTKQVTPIVPDGVYLSEPGDLAVDSEDNLYIANKAGQNVIVLNAQGERINSFAGMPDHGGGFFTFRPQGIAVDSERGIIYVSDSTQIQAFKQDGELITADWGADNTDFGYIGDIELDHAGNLYVADSNVDVNSIFKYSPDGELLDLFGGPGEADSQFKSLMSIGIDANGDVYATDSEAHRLSKFAYMSNRLSGLTLSSGAMNETFEPGRHQYSAELNKNVGSFMVTPEAFDENAEVRVNGVLVGSGEASASIEVSAGQTKKIMVEVTAKDGVKRAYTLSVTRQSSSSNNNSGSGEPVTANPIDVVVDGQENEAAQRLLKDAKVTAGEGGVTVDISEAGVSQLLGGHADAGSIVLRFDAGSSWIDLGLPQSLIRLASSNPNAVLELQTGFGALKLKLGDLLREMDGDATTMRLFVSKESLAPSQSLSIGAATVRLGLTAVSKSGESKPIVLKRGYVQFMLPIASNAGNLVGRKLAGVALNASGEVSYPLPTLFRDNKTAIIHLKGDAVFTVLRHMNTFSDGSAAAYAAEAIETLSNKFIVEGMTTGLFQPFGELNRAQYATLILRALGIQSDSPASGSTTGFSDITAEQWYGDAIATASGLGIINGYTDGTFKPNQAVNRQELLAIVYNALKLSDMAVELSDEETAQLLASFTDKDKIAPWSRKAVAFAVKHGIVQGQPNGSFAPTGAANRAQGSVVIYKMLQAAGLLDR